MSWQLSIGFVIVSWEPISEWLYYLWGVHIKFSKKELARTNASCWRAAASIWHIGVSLVCHFFGGCRFWPGWGWICRHLGDLPLFPRRQPGAHDLLGQEPWAGEQRDHGLPLTSRASCCSFPKSQQQEVLPYGISVLLLITRRLLGSVFGSELYNCLRN